MEITAIIFSTLSLIGVVGLTIYVYRNKTTDEKVSKLEKRQNEVDNILNNYELKQKKK